MAGPRIVPELLAAQGRPLDSVARVLVFGGGTEGERLEMARRMVVSYAIVPFYSRLLTRQGFGEEVEAIQACWRSGERASTAGQVSAAMLQEVVSVGGADSHREKVEAYWQAGLGTPVLWFHSPDRSPETLKRMMAEVASAR
jgi:alkanesulfonate monooxygenase SsuD/methylene tetrahydromethanopterin reductase-like flavin-dependent oxidoreductase (luciferase family)